MEKLQQLADWIDTLTLRERGFLLLSLIMAIFLVGDRLLLEPLDKQAKQVQIKLKKQNKDVNRLRQQQQQLVERSLVDPDAENLKQIAVLKKAMLKLNEQLQNMTVDLISPQQMVKVLEEVLTRETDLKLVSIESLPPLALMDKEDKTARKKQRSKTVLPGVYQHALKIEFEGSYLSTMAYLKELESLSRRFYWGSVDFTVLNYPRAHVVIIVNTLSLNEAWIGV